MRLVPERALGMTKARRTFGSSCLSGLSWALRMWMDGDWFF
jgi:hypothetical protein